MTTSVKTAGADVIVLLKAARLTFPQMRIGQLILSAIDLDPELHDLFHITDEDLAAKLREWMRTQLVQRVDNAS